MYYLRRTVASDTSQLASEKVKAQEDAHFHAQPCTSTVAVPFHTKKSDKPLTEVDVSFFVVKSFLLINTDHFCAFLIRQLNAFELNTEKRAVTRSMFDQQLRDKAKIEEVRIFWGFI